MFTKISYIIRLLTHRHKEPYFSLYKLLGFYPNNVNLYLQAFTHKSMPTELCKYGNNERMEFLGDALLSAIVAKILYKRFPNEQEGFLTNTRSKIVKRKMLNNIALELKLDERLIMNATPNKHNIDIYGNALEALIAAIFIDKGYAHCHNFVLNKMILPYIDFETITHIETNYKSTLMEWGQKRYLEIAYHTNESDNDEQGTKMFEAKALIGDILLGIGKGYSKKQAQQAAAKKSLYNIRNEGKIKSKIDKYINRQKISPSVSPVE